MYIVNSSKSYRILQFAINQTAWYPNKDNKNVNLWVFCRRNKNRPTVGRNYNFLYLTQAKYKMKSPIPQPSLKIWTNAIFCNYLGIIRDYGLKYIFFWNKTIFVFARQKDFLGRGQYQNKKGLFTDPIFSDGFDLYVQQKSVVPNVYLVYFLEQFMLEKV